jgi:hypothetical protein
LIPRWLLLIALAAAVAAVGTAVYWLSALDAPPHVTPAAVVGLFLTLGVVTLGFLLLRWLRWHYLLRRFTHAVRARDSLVL